MADDYSDFSEPAHSYPVSDAVQSAKDAGQAFAENAFNVIGLDPLTAALSTAWDMAHRSNAMNDLMDPNKHTWRDDYNDFRNATAARRAEVNSASPTAATAGTIAGNVYVGARALPAATEALAAKAGQLLESPLPAAAARYWGGAPARAVEQGGQSAVNEYRNNPNATTGDIATAAGTGAALSGTLNAAGAGIGALFEKSFLSRITQEMGDRARAALQAMGIARANTLDNNSAVSLLGQADPIAHSSVVQSVANDSQIGPMLKQWGSDAWDSVKDAIVPAGAGAAAGAYAANKMGSDPYEGAMVGAGTTVAATKGKILSNLVGQGTQVAGKTVLLNPNAIPNTVNAVVPGTIGAVSAARGEEKQAGYDDFSQPVEQKGATGSGYDDFSDPVK